VESIARPLRLLHEEATWFARATDVRLLHLSTDANLRGDALDLLMAQENHADNRALFFRFDDPFAGADLGWPARAQRLRELWNEKTTAVAPAGIKLPALSDLPGELVGTAAFGALLLAATKDLLPPLTGVVVVLAPVRVDDAEGLAFTLTALALSAHLSQVRWIVVETDGAAALPLAHSLNERAMIVDCLVDEKAQQDDLATQTSSASGGGRGAFPDVAAPTRIDARPGPTDDALRAAGLSPKFINGGGAQLKQLVLTAALALREGRSVDAVSTQARAAALCAEMEMPREQILNLHVLASYVLAANQRHKAREIYRGAVDLCRMHAATDLESQTEMALGLLDALDQRPTEAATHYSGAARLAETAAVIPLAIEAWRLAGQLALDAGLETSAVECWKRALALADPLDPALAKVTSAPQTALALAAMCRRHGLNAQAKALEERAVGLEGPK
jgi:hypothetical protein